MLRVRTLTRRVCPNEAPQARSELCGGYSKRIFGFFLGATRKKLARRGDIPASEIRKTAESQTSI